ncbi:MAG: transposase [Atribacterota bacterium]
MIGGSEDMEGNRRNYSEEFKKDAIQHSLTSEKAAVEVAQDLGIAHSNLRRWRAQYNKNGELVFPGNGKQKLTPQEEEIKRLKKELYDVRQERDILKKALAIFTKKT